MSKGTKVYPLRLPIDLVELVCDTIDRRNNNSKQPPWTLSDFLRQAIVDKLRKMHRSRTGCRDANKAGFPLGVAVDADAGGLVLTFLDNQEVDGVDLNYNPAAQWDPPGKEVD